MEKQDWFPVLIACVVAVVAIFVLMGSPLKQPEKGRIGKAVSSGGLVPMEILEDLPKAESPALEDPKSVKSSPSVVLHDHPDPCYVASLLTGAHSLDPVEGSGERTVDAEYFAHEFACHWEKEEFEELYGMFAPRLQAERTLKSFKGIMQHREVTAMQPYSIRVDKIDFFEEDSVGHVYYTADYKTGRKEHERRREPHRVIRLVDSRWVMDDFDDIFFKECFVNEDCKISDACILECEEIDQVPEATCDAIWQECSCHCVPKPPVKLPPHLRRYSQG